uniref:Uncharacterized protein n=1 Tax=Arundo donax TaxID=35708 RepID=A0A0A9B7S2_ARUDO
MYMQVRRNRVFKQLTCERPLWGRKEKFTDQIIASHCHYHHISISLTTLHMILVRRATHVVSRIKFPVPA